jgi:hypothetical protein
MTRETESVRGLRLSVSAPHSQAGKCGRMRANADDPHATRSPRREEGDLDAPQPTKRDSATVPGPRSTDSGPRTNNQFRLSKNCPSRHPIKATAAAPTFLPAGSWGLFNPTTYNTTIIAQFCSQRKSFPLEPAFNACYTTTRAAGPMGRAASPTPDNEFKSVNSGDPFSVHSLN